jgi:small subunit ribosomal protein S17
MPKKILTGKVVSNRMQKSVVVEVTYLKKHPLYGKYRKVKHKYMAHDEEKKCKIGDTVRIVESRPLSRLKRWRVTSVVQRGVIVEEAKVNDSNQNNS